ISELVPPIPRFSSRQPAGSRSARLADQPPVINVFDPPRSVVLLGGSNTLMTGGWSARLAERLPAGWRLENRGIGGTSSLMGIYRLLSKPDWQAGDVVVWEYAINEYPLMVESETPLSVLFDHIAWLVRLCEERRLCLLPVVMETEDQARMTDLDPYAARLRKFFADCGVPIVDCRVLRTSPPFAGQPTGAIYSDFLHYRLDAGFTEAIAQAVVDRLDGLKPLTQVPQREVAQRRARRLQAFTDFQGEGAAHFENSIIAIDYHRFSRGCTANVRGQIKGAIILATPDGAGFRLIHGSAGPRFATQCAYWSRSPILLQLSFDAHFFPARFIATRPVRFQRPGNPDAPRICLPQLQWAPDEARAGAIDGLVALIVESGPLAED
ncbi:MAG: SGNH/GDSL hydrolase family protein, partial [Rhodobacterales bacterium]|nr:SGNH/GDSL hydrolase family protein [Rhodobacterales bacterium]